jgi:Membrane fusion protein Use1
MHHRQTPSSNSTNVHEEETAQIEHVLQHHRQLQEELTGDLSKMAAQLKSNSLAFGDLLEKDDQVIGVVLSLRIWEALADISSATVLFFRSYETPRMLLLVI